MWLLRLTLYVYGIYVLKSLQISDFLEMLSLIFSKHVKVQKIHLTYCPGE